MGESLNTIQTRRLLPTNYGVRLFNIGLTTGWEDSSFELYMHSDGVNSTDVTNIHLAINTKSSETLELAGNAMQVSYPSAARLIEGCRRNIAEGETEHGQSNVYEIVERKIARLVLANMNQKHEFVFGRMHKTTLTNLLFLATRHEPTEHSMSMYRDVKSIARQSVLV